MRLVCNSKKGGVFYKMGRETFRHNDPDLFHEKEELLRDLYGAPVEPMEFYYDLFDGGRYFQGGEDGGKGNMIYLVKPNGNYIKEHNIDVSFRPYNRIVNADFDELWTVMETAKPWETYMSPSCSFLGKNKTIANSYELYSMTIDIDDLSLASLDRLTFFFNNPPGQMMGKLRPTYLVNSGNGVHLYYILPERRYLHKKYNYTTLCDLKTYFSDRLWDGDVSTKKKKESHGLVQNYGVVGTYTKWGTDKISAYKVGDRVSLQQIFDAIPNLKDKRNKKDADQILYIINYKPKKKSTEPDEPVVSVPIDPEPAPPVEKPKTGKSESIWREPWKRKVNKKFYDWWFKKIYDGAEQGHRYYCIMCLAAVAIKCGVSKEQLQTDAYSLIDTFNNRGDKPFTKQDVDDALTAYKKSFALYKRKNMEKASGIPIPPRKRNHRPQRNLYYQEINSTYTSYKVDGMSFANWKRIKEYKKRRPNVKVGDLVAKGHMEVLNDGMSDGTFLPRNSFTSETASEAGRKGNKEQVVRDYLRDHPEASKADIIKATGLTKPTVYKWWRVIKNESLDGVWGSSDTTS